MSKFRGNFYRAIGLKIGKNFSLGVGSILDVWDPKIPHEFGKNTTVGEFSFISGGVFIGENAAINSNVNITASPPSTITIGSHCLIGQNVVIRANDHKFTHTDCLIREQGHVGSSISIEDDCWIGANSTCLKGVHLGAHSVAGAGCVLNKNFPSYSIVAGNPARLIKSRKI